MPKINRPPTRPEVDRALRELEVLWRPPDKKENPQDAERRSGFSNVVRLASRPKKYNKFCVACGISFFARSPMHDRCASCYRWALAGYHAAKAAAALRGDR